MEQHDGDDELATLEEEDDDEPTNEHLPRRVKENYRPVDAEECPDDTDRYERQYRRAKAVLRRTDESREDPGIPEAPAVENGIKEIQKDIDRVKAEIRELSYNRSVSDALNKEIEENGD